MIITNIDFDKWIANLGPGQRRNFFNLTDFKDRYSDLEKKLVEVGYSPATLEVHSYNVGIDFDKSYIDQFDKAIGATMLRAWIARISPGKTSGLHVDIDYKAHEYEHYGDRIIREMCFMSKPDPGHVFILGDTAYYDLPRGTVLSWKDRHELHTGVNCGLTPKYNLHYIGYR